jgi:hypothetical protein
MEVRYLTRHGSIYIQKLERDRESWFKKEKNGGVLPIEDAVLIAFKRLQELLRQYRASLLDKTCFPDVNIGRDFLQEIKQEQFIGDIEDTEANKTSICFLMKTGDQYKLGCTSSVVRMESCGQKKDF